MLLFLLTVHVVVLLGRLLLLVLDWTDMYLSKAPESAVFLTVSKIHAPTLSPLVLRHMAPRTDSYIRTYCSAIELDSMDVRSYWLKC